GRGARAGQGATGAAAESGRDGRVATGRFPSAVGPRRGARHLCRVAGGVQQLRPAAYRRGRGMGEHRSQAPLRQCGGARPGLQLRSARSRFRRRTIPADHHQEPRPGRCERVVHHLGALEPRRGPSRHPVRASAARGVGSTVKAGRDWLLSRGTEPQMDAALGLQRARAATLLELALPGSSYLYQGEELGLHEVADIPDEARQDPSFFRNPGVDMGRDGCRVPIPWSVSGPSFGFGETTADLPQPDWFSRYAVQAQDGVQGSTLQLYRDALRLRGELLGDESLEWAEDVMAGQPDLLAFRRSSGWLCVTNFGDAPVALPPGQVLLTSVPLVEERLPGAATAWLRG